eukprot:g7017.t1
MPLKSFYLWLKILSTILLLIPERISSQQNEVEINESNASRFQRLVSGADAGTTFILSTDVELDSTISISAHRITLRGLDSETRPVIRCRTENEAAFRISSDEVEFADLTIRDCRETPVSVSSVVVSDNPFEQQDAREPVRLHVQFRNVEFLNNSALQNAGAGAGAIYLGRRVEAAIDQCTFEGNSAPSGGAIRSLGNSLQITNSIFRNNTATNSGGAIHGTVSNEDRQRRSISITSTQFQYNRVLVGREDRSGLMIANGVPLEADQYLRFPLPAPSGGALNLESYDTVNIVSSEFDGNSAVPAGGAIHLLDNGRTEIRNCNFSNNFVEPIVSAQNNTEELQFGGAIFVAFSEQSSRLEITASRFVNNNAIYGGAVHIVAPVAARINLRATEFRQNVASRGGGALLIRNVNTPELTRCTFIQNSAFVGGGIFLTNGAGLEFIKAVGSEVSRFLNNSAIDGGAIYGIGFGSVRITSSHFDQNQAQHHGGAICFVDSKAGGSFQLQGSILRNNSAEEGGALFLENIELVRLLIDRNQRGTTILSGARNTVQVNEFISNAAVAGGAIYYRAVNSISNSFIATRCQFVNNQAHSRLPGVRNISTRSEDMSTGFRKRLLQQTNTATLSDQSLLDPIGSTPCHPGGGGAICFVLSGISNRIPVSIQVVNSYFQNNSASVGGGLFLSTDEMVDWTRDCPSVGQTSSSSLTTNPCRTIQLRNLTFIDNFASRTGGGIFASNLTQVQYSSAAVEVSTDLYRPLSNSTLSENMGPNLVGDGGYGPNIASMATGLRVRHPVLDPRTGLLISNQSSGQSNPLPLIRIEILDQLNQLVSAGIQDSELRVRVRARSPVNGASITSGQIDAVAESGIATFSALALLASAGIYQLEFVPQRQSIQRTTGRVEIRSCLLGEMNNTAGFVCETCGFESFSFDTEKGSCDSCPVHAQCVEGASLVPLPKYWHSSPFSTIMHECFHQDACNYESRINKLEEQHLLNRHEFFDRIQANEGVPVFTNDEYPQCADGYEGPLCGACEEGYGRTDGKTCEKCASRSGTASVVFLLAIWQFALLLITIRSALTSMRDMNYIAGATGQTTVTTGATIPTQAITSTHQGVLRVSNTMSREIDVQSEDSGSHTITVPTPVAVKQQFSVDCIVAAQHISETIKIFVNFFQVTSVAIDINVQWTTTVRNMLSTMSAVGGFSNGATFTPMTCMLDRDTDNQSIYGVILSIAFPLGLLLLVLVFFTLQWWYMMRSPRYRRADCSLYLRSRVIMSFLVTVFFSYQSISDELMGTVSCIRLDSKEINERTLYPDYSTARDLYWTQDTNILCFEEKHAYLAGILGIPGMVLFLVGVPVYLLIFLLYQRHENKLEDSNVLGTYGFMYQSYETKFVFWEVMILLRKALISAVIIFAYPLGSNLQGVMALGVLIIALAAHLIAKPFKYFPLNILEGCSLIVSIFTFYTGVVFNDENTTHVADILLSALLVLINLGLVIAFLVCVFIYTDKYVVAKLNSLGFSNVPANFIPRVLKLIKVVSEQATGNILNTLKTAHGFGNGKRKQNASNVSTSPPPPPSPGHTLSHSHSVAIEEDTYGEISIELPDHQSNEGNGYQYE